MKQIYDDSAPADLSGATTKGMGEESGRIPTPELSETTSMKIGEESPLPNADLSDATTKGMGEEGGRPNAPVLPPTSLFPPDLSGATTRGMGEEGGKKPPEADISASTSSMALGGEEGLGVVLPEADLSDATTKGMGEEGGKLPNRIPASVLAADLSGMSSKGMGEEGRSPPPDFSDASSKGMGEEGRSPPPDLSDATTKGMGEEGGNRLSESDVIIQTSISLLREFFAAATGIGGRGNYLGPQGPDIQANNMLNSDQQQIRQITQNFTPGGRA